MGALLEETECLASGTALSVLEDKVKKLDLLKITAKRLTRAACLSMTRRTLARSVSQTASLSLGDRLLKGRMPCLKPRLKWKDVPRSCRCC